MLRSDNGTEYVNSRFKSYFTDFGIIHQTTCPYTPEQNGLSERKNRHIIETTRALLHHSSMLHKFWTEAVLTAVYLINRMPSNTLNHVSPFEKLFRHRPDYTLLKTFGCLCFPWLKPYASSKLEPRSHPCCFIGYCPHTKGYRCFELSSGRVFISRHVSFLEHSFPFADPCFSTFDSSLL